MRASSVSTRTPDDPRARTLARSAIVARTVGDRQRVADACRVTSQQIGLKCAQGVVRDAHVGKRSESGVDAIDGGVAIRRPIHDAASRGDAGARALIEYDASVLAGDRRELAAA